MARSRHCAHRACGTGLAPVCRTSIPPTCWNSMQLQYIMHNNNCSSMPLCMNKRSCTCTHMQTLTHTNTPTKHKVSLGMERLQGSHSVLGWNDSRGVILSGDGTAPGESFCPGMQRLQGSPSVLGWNDSMGVFLSWDGKTPGESFCLEME